MHPEMEPNYSKQRLIFRPKSLLLGWWGGMHPPIPPPKSATGHGVGKLKGRTSQYQAFAYAIAWLLIPALLNLAHPYQPVAIASISLCFHPTPRGDLRLGFVGWV